jgi:hypothetical protein
MFNLLKPSAKSLFHTTLNQYQDIVSRIEELTSQEYSYVRFCVKRQLELELLDLTTILANVSPNLSEGTQLIIRNEKIPITLVDTTTFDYSVYALKHFDIHHLVTTLSSIKLTRIASSDPALFSRQQKYVFDTYFPKFARKPFMTVETFWQIINHVSNKPTYNPNIELPGRYYSYYYNNLVNNQGNLYDHFY